MRLMSGYLFKLREKSVGCLLKDGSQSGKIAPKHYNTHSAEEVCLGLTGK